MQELYSLYLHISFCIHRCAYCDFNTYAEFNYLIPDYIKALCQEINTIAESLEYRLPVHSIYFGGGTPSIVPLELLGKVLDTIKGKCNLSSDTEITLEANPGTVSKDYLYGLKLLGVNRLSLGMQSANINDLRILERLHGLSEVNQAIQYARDAGFNNINLDLIFGIPQQLDIWGELLEVGLSTLWGITDDAANTGHPAHRVQRIGKKTGVKVGRLCAGQGRSEAGLCLAGQGLPGNDHESILGHAGLAQEHADFCEEIAAPSRSAQLFAYPAVYAPETTHSSTNMAIESSTMAP